MEKKSRDFFIAAIRYVILISGVMWVLRNPFILDLQISYGDNSGIDISFLRWPLVSLISGFFLGRITEHFLIGSWNYRIRDSMRFLGIVVCTYILFSQPQSPESLRLNSSIFLLGAIWLILLNLAEKTLGQNNRALEYSLRSIWFVSLGVLASTIVTRMPEISIEGLALAILIAGLLSGAISFSGLYEGTLNGYASYIGESYGNKTRQSVFVILVLSLYALVYRDLLISDFGPSSGFILLMEWGTVTFLGYSIFRKIRKNVSVSSGQKGNWKTHVQALERRHEKGLDKWSRVVDDFIKRGDKTLLVVYLVELQSRNEVSLDRIRIELEDLINWSENGVNLGLVFNEGQKERELEEHRRIAVGKVLDRIQERIG